MHSGFEPLFISWNTKLLKLKNEQQLDSQAFSPAKLKILRRLESMTKDVNLLVKNWDSRIKSKCQILDGVKKGYKDCDDQIQLDDEQVAVEKDVWSFKVNDTQTDKFKIAFSTAFYTYRMIDGKDSQIELFKFGLISPSSFIENEIVKTLQFTGHENLISIIWQTVATLALLIVGFYAFYTTSR